MNNGLKLGIKAGSAIIIRLFLIIITLILGLFYHEINLLAVYSLIVYASIIFLYSKTNESLFSEYVLVLLFFILFHGGQVFIHLIEPNRYLPVFEKFSEDTLWKGYFYSLLCIQVFDVSFMFFQCQLKSKKIQKPCQKNYLKTARICSNIGLSFLTPVVLIETATKTYYSLRYGYMNLYDYNGAGYVESAFMPYLRNFFVILCILNIISVSYDKKKSRIALLLMLIYGAFMFASGSRGGSLSVFLPALLIYSTKIKKISAKKMVPYIILIIVLMFASVFMSKYRLIIDKANGGVQDALSYVIESNPISETFIEMGGSLNPLLYCIDIFGGSETFKLGSSYIASFFLLVPNVFQILGEVHPAAGLSNLSQWLMDYMKLDHGPGFSIAAESFYNFGYAGCLVFFIWGFIFNRILGKTGSQNEERDFISYSALVLIFGLIRGSTSDFIRMFVFEVIIFNLILKLLAKVLKS